MSKLCNSKCTACSVESSPVTGDEAEALIQEVPEWSIITVDGVSQLKRVFKFRNFTDAIAFTNKVGDLAEENGHHPALLTEWGRVTVTYWTHKIKGLHKSDFIMSAKTDKLYGAAP
jgi:4a-hydroxytetrahydrobiopterin dehydratase